MRSAEGAVRLGRPMRVWAMVGALLLGTLLCAIGALWPPTPQSPTTVNAIAAAVGPPLALVVWWPGRRWLEVRLHLAGVVVLGLAMVLVATSATGEGAMSSAMVVVWLSLYAAAFHARPVARAYQAAGAVALAIALAVNPVIVAGPGAWVVVATSSVLAAELVSTLIGHMTVLATTDQLTGLPNRHALPDLFARRLRSTSRRQQPLSLALVDLDGLKGVNDRFGHSAGDRMLVEAAKGWQAGLPGADVVRLGGDEFVVLLSETVVRAEATLAAVRADWASSFSFGVVDVRGEQRDLLACMAAADTRMYASKRERHAGFQPDDATAGRSARRLASVPDVSDAAAG